MRIQVIQYDTISGEREGVTFSPLSAPRAIDDFDINIVDLSIHNMWTYCADTIGKVDAYRDLETIQLMVSNKRKAVVIYAFPQNIRYTYAIRY